MKNKIQNVIATLRQESLPMQMAMAITLFAFASAFLITLGQASGIFWKADIGGEYPAESEPYERPTAPGYQRELPTTVDNSIDNAQTQSKKNEINRDGEEKQTWYKNILNIL